MWATLTSSDRNLPVPISVKTDPGPGPNPSKFNHILNIVQDTLPYDYPRKFQDRTAVVPVFFKAGRMEALKKTVPRVIEALLQDKAVVFFEPLL